MSPNEYQALALRTEAPWRQSQDFAITRAVQAMHAVLGLSSEVGEIADFGVVCLVLFVLISAAARKVSE